MFPQPCSQRPSARSRVEAVENLSVCYPSPSESNAPSANILCRIYCSPATREILLRLETKMNRIGYETKVLEARKVQYGHLEKILVCARRCVSCVTNTLAEANTTRDPNRNRIEARSQATSYTVRCESLHRSCDVL